MSELLKRYEESKKPRPSEAKQIPSLAVNMFDITNQYQVGFTTLAKRGDSTKFTGEAMDYFKKERSEITPPDNFVPTEPDITLSRWSAENPYSGK